MNVVCAGTEGLILLVLLVKVAVDEEGQVPDAREQEPRGAEGSGE